MIDPVVVDFSCAQVLHHAATAMVVVLSYSFDYVRVGMMIMGNNCYDYYYDDYYYYYYYCYYYCTTVLPLVLTTTTCYYYFYTTVTTTITTINYY